MLLKSLWCNVRSWGEIKNSKLTVAIFFVLAVIFLGNVSFAADNNIRRYEVVAGTEDKSFLVDTATGFVWVLTYRTMATGREPIAIPYKFIKICPKNSKEFLVEDAKEGACLPTRKE
jgi:hypothetical protein